MSQQLLEFMFGLWREQRWKTFQWCVSINHESFGRSASDSKMHHSQDFLTYVIQHVKNAAIPGSVHGVVSRDEHSQWPRAPQRRRVPTVLNTHWPHTLELKRLKIHIIMLGINVINTFCGQGQLQNWLWPQEDDGRTFHYIHVQTASQNQIRFGKQSEWNQICLHSECSLFALLVTSLVC